jgi:hypothetical protein
MEVLQVCTRPVYAPITPSIKGNDENQIERPSSNQKHNVSELNSVGFDKGPEHLDYEPDEAEDEMEPEPSETNPETSEVPDSKFPHGQEPLEQRLPKSASTKPMVKPELDKEEAEKLRAELKKRSDNRPTLPASHSSHDLTSPSYSVSDSEQNLEANRTDISTAENPRVR